MRCDRCGADTGRAAVRSGFRRARSLGMVPAEAKALGNNCCKCAGEIFIAMAQAKKDLAEFDRQKTEREKKQREDEWAWTRPLTAAPAEHGNAAADLGDATTGAND